MRTLARSMSVLSAALLLGCGSAPKEASAPAPTPEAATAPADPMALPPPPPPAPEGSGPSSAVEQGGEAGTEPDEPKLEDPRVSPPAPGVGNEVPKATVSKKRVSVDEASRARPLAAVAEATGERISRDVLARAVDENLEAFRRCASTDARVRVRLSLSGGGSVTKVEALRSQPDDARLRDCVVEVLGRLSFPRGAGSETSAAEFDLVLSKPAF